MLGKVTAVDLDDIKDHLSEHKVAYSVGAGISTGMMALTLWHNMRAKNLPLEEDDYDLEDVSIVKK